MIDVVRCKNDIRYFAENAFTVSFNRIDGTYPNRLSNAQATVLSAMKVNPALICKGDRRSGKSLLQCLFSIWSVLFDNRSSTMIYPNKNMALCHLGNIADMLNSLVTELAQQFTVNVRESIISFSSGLTITSYSVKNEKILRPQPNILLFGQPENPDIVFLDELAYFHTPTILNFKKEYNKIIVCSTSSVNTNNVFDVLWKQTLDPRDKFNTIFTPITLSYLNNPVSDKERLEQMRELFDEKTFNTEYGLSLGGTTCR